ncbi:MAG: hypothetical protein ACLRR3_00600 [Eubacterium sp.]
MKEHQAREIIFEEKVKKLLQDSNYINIVEQNIPGEVVPMVLILMES